MLSNIHKPIFFGSLGLLLLVTLPLILFPEVGRVWVMAAQAFVSRNFGMLYLGMGLASLGFMIYIVFSDIGQIKLGDIDAEPEFSLLSWGAMLFAAGIGGAVVFWGMVEWMYYLQSPPFHLEPFSEEATAWAATYGMFHWGPIAWSIYLVPALPMAYFLHVRKNKVLRISEAIRPVLGEKLARSWLGNVINILFIFGMLGGGATSLGILVPLINEGLGNLFNFTPNAFSQILVLIGTTALFAASAWRGLKGGIELLSDINMWLGLGVLLFVLVAGPTVFILETGLNSIGLMLSNLVRMATWTEPFGALGGFEETGFSRSWTIFYWAWWLVFAPTVGLFIARISKGRRIKTMVAGSIFFGSLGCALFFIILGNYGLYLQLSGTLDVIQIMNDSSANAAFYAVLGELPLTWLVTAAVVILLSIFTATTFDSIAYILSSAAEKNLEEEPGKFHRLFWAFTLSFLPMSLLFLGGLETLQTASIVSGVPLLLIAVLLMMSMVRAAKYDLRYQPDYSDPEINIEEFPENDPWSEEGSWELPDEAEDEAPKPQT
ncbi:MULTISPECIES: BCCT family transporter [unclassified Halomonas]|uniref:BCCT family transporter n=1 Tax=unclassified Halomonas TaxID=2609666 RepID=UPI0021E39679|nr:MULTISPECIES: BCCT family transporter [unclassified Halomonas]UYF98380.1 BCCT family transporter [Halomonas sp. GD1P12]WNL40497.1 BCCT family transporter [Halomonas sp. PAMB 3232]